MTRRGLVGLAVISGVSALSCHTPSSVRASSSPAPAVWADAAPRTDWPAPSPGKQHTLMPTPKTVAWGWYDAAGAALWLARLCAGGAPAAILQNGVEHVERFAPYLPAAQILPVMIDCPAERSASQHVVQRGPARIVVPDDPRG